MSAHLSHEEFFSQLTALISKAHEIGHGSVYLTQKRLTFDQNGATDPPTKEQDDPLWDLNPPNPLPLIIRATDGKTQSKDGKKNKNKVKISTIVQPDEIEAFFARYAEVSKAGMQGLRKRDRSKRKKDKNKKRKAPTGPGEDKKP